MEIPIKMDDLGVPLFSETPRWLGIGISEASTASTATEKKAVDLAST